MMSKFDAESLRSLYETYPEKTRERSCEAIKNIIASSLEEAGIANTIYCRFKTYKSALKKLIEKKNPSTIDYDFTDLIGLRVVVLLDNQIDKCISALRKEFDIDECNTTDKRLGPNPEHFSYRSYHLVANLDNERISRSEYKFIPKVKFEIQIRTQLMHAWAEIEHKLGYKGEAQLPDHLRRRFSAASACLELVDRELNQIDHEISKIAREAIETPTVLRNPSVPRGILNRIIEQDDIDETTKRALRNQLRHSIQNKNEARIKDYERLRPTLLKKSSKKDN